MRISKGARATLILKHKAGMLYNETASQLK
jgi:hypothetical protein